jgi:hypothetical protein
MTAIDDKYTELGGAGGFLGSPVIDETPTPDAIGAYRQFDNGFIYWSPETGAHEIHGGIFDRWAELGWEAGALGYPLTDETSTQDGAATFNQFQQGFIYWIDEPNVKQRITEYPEITFQPGDNVVIEAGGCAQTGGSGDTWKRYVDPQGKNSDRLYHGLAWVPGATQGLTRIEAIVGSTLTIPQNIPDPSQLYLRLGYEDDDYSDNGYWGRDPGTGNQCRGLPNAFVRLTIINVPASPGPGPGPGSTTRAPFDLIWDSVDDNLIPLNPQWAFQVENPGSIPDPQQLCDGFPLVSPWDPTKGITFGSPACTTQSPSIDIATGWNGFWCGTGGEAGQLAGHVNWGPATYTGPITWEEKSNVGADDDYNFRLTPPNQAGLVPASDGTLELEFDSDETIDYFTTPWWDSFHNAVDESKSAAGSMVLNKYAIVVGLLGLDAEHSSHTEIHPVWGMAICVNQDPQDETWAIFARNFGNEGYCSQDQHYLDLLGNTIKFRLPWRRGATSVSVAGATVFRTNDTRVTGPGVQWAAGQGVVVSFTLPRPEDKPRVHGELHLQWAGNLQPPVASPSVDTLFASVEHAHVEHQPSHEPAPIAMEGSMARPREQEDRAEDRVNALIQQMNPQQLATFSSSLQRNISPDVQAAQGTGAGVQVNNLPQPDPAGQSPSERAVRDPAKIQKDKRNFQAFYAAFGGNIPGVPAPLVSRLANIAGTLNVMAPSEHVGSAQAPHTQSAPPDHSGIPGTMHGEHTRDTPSDHNVPTGHEHEPDDTSHGDGHTGHHM